MIARHELARVMMHPVVVFAVLLLIIIALLNGVGGARHAQSIDAGPVDWDPAVSWLSSSAIAISMVCTMMAVFLGATSIPYERWNNSVSVLLSKPLYRWDFVLGKFFGLSAFMLAFNTFILLLVSFLTIIFYQAPQSDFEFTWRLAAYIVALTLSCSLIIALNMLFGIISKNILVVTSASILYIFFDWIWRNENVLGDLSIFTPVHLYNKLVIPFIIGGDPVPLFDTLVPFGQWFYGVLPFLAIILIEMSVFLLLGVYIFSREDRV